jgi:hypothetical protein
MLRISSLKISSIQLYAFCSKYKNIVYWVFFTVFERNSIELAKIFVKIFSRNVIYIDIFERLLQESLQYLRQLIHLTSFLHFD